MATLAASPAAVNVATTSMLPLLPSADSNIKSTTVIAKPSEFININVEPAGRYFEARLRRKCKGRTISADERETERLQRLLDEAALNSDDEFDEETPDLLLLDPLNWKKQDHYKVLGVRSRGIKASQEELKRAHKAKVLKHHPDKKSQEGGNIDDDGFFKCIQKAYEILSDPVSRRSFDSVDPTFDDYVPKINASNKENFFKVFGPIFKANAQWTTGKVSDAPNIGDLDTPKSEFEEFYNYWANFESWREFSYLDEDNTEQGDNREEKRWKLKENKAKRDKKRKEELQRLQLLVDNAISCDPRVRKYKEEEKAAKEAKKAAKLAEKENALAAERAAQEAILAEKAAAEAEEKAAADRAKCIREAEKKCMKKERKALRTICKQHEYFVAADAKENATMDAIAKCERLCEKLTLENIQRLNAELVEAAGLEECHAVFNIALEELDEEEATRKAASSKAIEKLASPISVVVPWTAEEEELFVKAVNLFPPGTIDRYGVIANYINLRVKPQGDRTNKDIIRKIKNSRVAAGTGSAELAFKAFEERRKASAAPSLPSPTQADINENKLKKQTELKQQKDAEESAERAAAKIAREKAAKEALEAEKKLREEEAAMQAAALALKEAKAKEQQKAKKERRRLRALGLLDGSDSASPSVTPPNEPSVEIKEAPKKVKKVPSSEVPLEQKSKTDWTAEQQAALEQALKSIDASVSERWEKIAAMVPGRTVMACKKRYKALADAVKAKKGKQ